MLIQGDARHLPLQAQSVHCVVTSPPYWGLRDYKTATWDGGDPACGHFKLAGGTSAQNLGKSATASAANVERSSVPYRERCGQCGAIRVDLQIGLEPTPDRYVTHLVEVMREVKRVLRDDGTLWLNLGDSYNAYNGGAGPSSALSRGAQTSERPNLPTGYGLKYPGLKPKDLVGIPWRVAFALQADGWYLRSDIIWSKPNPMPESVTDRPTKAHEYLFLLAKSERYYYDAAAIAERGAWCGRELGIVRGVKVRAEAMGRLPSGNEKPGANAIAPDVRNRRSVWTIATQPYHEAHFATFPEDLVAPCVLAGSPPGGNVLDPFAGSGTVGQVCSRLGRKAVLVELAHHYIPLARERTAQMGLV